MKWIVIVGIISSIVNMVIHFNDDPAFWAWLSSACWASCVLISELSKKLDQRR